MTTNRFTVRPFRNGFGIYDRQLGCIVDGCFMYYDDAEHFANYRNRLLAAGQDPYTPGDLHLSPRVVVGYPE